MGLKNIKVYPHPILFLDIDGVMNCRALGYDKIHQVFVDRLNRITDTINGKLVLSSTWRHDRNWKARMVQSGIKAEFLGVTPDLQGLPGAIDSVRGDEIQVWIEKFEDLSGCQVTRFACIDDNADFLEGQKLFQTKDVEDVDQCGITEAVVHQILEFFNCGSGSRIFCDLCGREILQEPMLSRLSSVLPRTMHRECWEIFFPEDCEKMRKNLDVLLDNLDKNETKI